MNADYEEQNQGTGAQRGREPLFYVSVQLRDDNEVPDEEIKERVIPEFVDPQKSGSTSKVEDFDPLAHLELEEPREEAEDEDEGEGEGE